MANLNGVLSAFLGISAPFSPIVLVLALSLLMLNVPKSRSFCIQYVLLLSFFAYFWFVGLTMSSVYYIGTRAILHSTRVIATSTILITAYYFYFLNVQAERKIDSLIKTIFWIFVITSLFTAIESVSGMQNMYMDEMSNRARGFFGNPNETGLQCNLLFGLALYLYSKGRINMIIFGVATGLAIYGALVSFSKSAMILTFLIFLFYVFYHLFSLTSIGKKGAIRYISFIVILLTFIIVFIVPKAITYLETLSYTQMERIRDTYALVFELKVDQNTTSDRTIALSQGFEVYKQSPIFGLGLNSFSQGDMFELGLGVHNSYLKILGEGGIISILLWFAFIFSYLHGSLFRVSRPASFFPLVIILTISFYFMVSHTVLSRKFVVPLIGIAMAMFQTNRLKVKSK